MERTSSVTVTRTRDERAWTLTQNQMLVLEHLVNEGEDRLRFWLNDGNRARTVRSLLKHGLIERHGEDLGPSSLYRLTDDGRGVYEAATR